MEPPFCFEAFRRAAAFALFSAFWCFARLHATSLPIRSSTRNRVLVISCQTQLCKLYSCGRRFCARFRKGSESIFFSAVNVSQVNTRIIIWPALPLALRRNALCPPTLCFLHDPHIDETEIPTEVSPSGIYWGKNDLKLHSPAVALPARGRSSPLRPLAFRPYGLRLWWLWYCHL